jgi:hypothetical protein
MRNAHKILIWKPEGKRPFGRPRHRWADIINIKGMGLEDVDCIEMALDKVQQYALVNLVMNLPVSQSEGIST